MNVYCKEGLGLIPRKLRFRWLFKVVVNSIILNFEYSYGMSSKTFIFRFLLMAVPNGLVVFGYWHVSYCFTTYI